MNKLNNLLQNFDYILTIISTIKYLKTEKFLEIHVLFFCRLNRNIKIANFCTNIIRFYYLRYYDILNLITLIVFQKLWYSKLSAIFQIFYSRIFYSIFVLFLAFRIKFQKIYSTNILTSCIGYLSDYRKRWDFDGKYRF